MSLHKVLLRQMRKHKLREDQLPSSVEQWQDFLKVLSNIYEQNEEDQYLLQRSLEISSKEMRERIASNKKLTLELAQASKLASIGTLASGIAHELNNPLQIINGFTELIRLKSDDANFVTKHATKIFEITKRMASIIDYLLKLSHKEMEDNMQLLSIEQTIQETIDLMRRQLQYDNIQIEVNGMDEDILIKASAGPLSSVFHNLIANSRDAFLSSNERPKDPYIKIDLKDNPEDGVVNIFFEDNAGGIPEDVLAQIFDPFFTTKQVGKGTGLGLSLSRQTIEVFKGEMAVEVVDNKTLFKISLPRAVDLDEISSISQVNVGDVSAVKLNSLQNKRILVVDDESDICSIIATNLDSKNLDVTSTTSPEEAIQLLENEHFDLLLTDLRMPKVSGLQLAEKAQTLLPDCKVIIFSGHSLNTEQGTGKIQFKFLKKPASTDELYDEIQDLLKVA